MCALGKAFYEAHKDDMTEFGDRITGINDIYNEILLLEAEIKKLKEKLPEEEKIYADKMDHEAADIVEEAKSAMQSGQIVDAAEGQEAAEPQKEETETENQ